MTERAKEVNVTLRDERDQLEQDLPDSSTGVMQGEGEEELQPDQEQEEEEHANDMEEEDEQYPQDEEESGENPDG